MELAILGTGLMGGAMAERLFRCGHGLTVYNRTREKAVPLAGLGIGVEATPAQAIARATGVILMLSDGAAIRDVLFPSSSTAPGISGRTIIQMGTILPEESRSFQQAVEQAGGEYLEAPVLGSTPQVREGKLMVMVGSTKRQFKQWAPVLARLSPAPRHVGPVGKAAALKLAFNQLIVSLTAAFSFSLGLVQRWEIDVEMFMSLLKDSPLYAPQFEKKLKQMLSRDFSQPHFSTPHMLKDVRLMLAEGRALGLDTHMLDGIRLVLEQALDLGCADQDYSSLYHAVNPES